MARLSRAEIFDPSEIVAAHTISKTVRACYLLGDDQLTGKNFDHRKRWFEDKLKQLAANFGIDLLAFACLSNHFHLVLRSRPDVVATWDDTEVARRWCALCPKRKVKQEIDGQSIWIPAEPTELDLNSIRNEPVQLAAIRIRLSDISWWMRLLCQYIALRANGEDGEGLGRFWQSRFKAVRILRVAGKRGSTPMEAPAIFERLGIDSGAWAETVKDFGRLFKNVAGKSTSIEQARSLKSRRKFYQARV